MIRYTRYLWRGGDASKDKGEAEVNMERLQCTFDTYEKRGKEKNWVRNAAVQPWVVSVRLEGVYSSCVPHSESCILQEWSWTIPIMLHHSLGVAWGKNDLSTNIVVDADRSQLGELCVFLEAKVHFLYHRNLFLYIHAESKSIFIIMHFSFWRIFRKKKVTEMNCSPSYSFIWILLPVWL